MVGEFAPGDETWYMLGLDLIAQDSSATGWSYPLTDGLGSARAVMGSGNSVLHATNYDPYGNPLAVGGLTQSAFGFTGQQTDDTGLQYLRARYYSPALGTFLTTDPVLGVSGSPVSTFNPYSYVRGNTVNLTDPSGMIAPLRLIARAAILSGAISAAMEAANQLSQNGNDWDCLDLNKIGMAGLQGAVLGGLSAAFGLATAGAASGVGAFVFGETFDFFAGTMWDMHVNGMSQSEAVLNNAVGLGLGGAFALLGQGAKRLGPSLGGADVNVNSRGAAARRGADVCGVNSFSAETVVVTADGDVAISEIEVGDTVLAYNEATGETGEYLVTATIAHHDPTVVYLTISGEMLTTTAEHPFYTTDGEWIDAGELPLGAEIVALDGTFGTVEAITMAANAQPMYNLIVHTFFILCLTRLGV